MTPMQVSVLNRASAMDDVMPGTSLLAEQQRGRLRQVKWLLKRKMIRKFGGRLVATLYGRRILDYQLSR